MLLLTSLLVFGLVFGVLRAADAGAAVLSGLHCHVGIADNFLLLFLLVLSLSSFLSLALLWALSCYLVGC